MTLDPHGSRVSDTNAWQRIAEALMLGVFHDIGSRVSALAGIAKMGRMDVSFEETLLPLLESEVSKLSRTMELVTLLPRQLRSSAEPTIVQLVALVPDLLELHRHNPDLETIEYRYVARTAGAVVRVNHSTLCHSLLSVFSVLGWSALRDGYTAVDVEVVEEGDRIVVKAERALASTGPTTGGAVPDDLSGLTEEVVSAVDRAVQEAGGVTTAKTGDPDGLTAFELRLPMLRNHDS